MNTRATLIIACLVLAGSIILGAITPAQRAFLLDNVVTSTPAEPSLSSPPTVPPIGPYNEYAPLILDTISTSTVAPPPPTATLEYESTSTVPPPPTVPPDATPTIFNTNTPVPPP